MSQRANGEHVIDPAKIDTRIAELEAAAIEHERIADALEEDADERRREAARLRGQNAALLEAARKYGYPEPDDPPNAWSEP